MATPDPNLINTTDFFIDPTTVSVDLSDSRKFSFVQRLGTQVQFGYAGGRYLNLGDIEGGFVGAEGGAKPVANPATTAGAIAVREWAVVVPIPKRLLDANPQSAVQLIRQKLPEAFARGFDNLATTGAGVSGQSNLSQVTNTVSLGTTANTAGGIWKDFNSGLRILAQSRKKLTGTVLDFIVEPAVNEAIDTTGRPLFVDSPVGPDSNSIDRQGRLLGRPATFVDSIQSGAGPTGTVGYMGDWSRLLWGTVGGIQYMVSTEGTYNDGTTVHSAVQENLVLFRAEALIGIQVADLDAFVRLLNGQLPPTS